MHICAWCERKLGIRPGTVRGVSSMNFGICPDCLAERLAALSAGPPETPHKSPVPLGVTRRAAARRLPKAV